MKYLLDFQLDTDVIFWYYVCTINFSLLSENCKRKSAIFLTKVILDIIVF